MPAARPGKKKSSTRGRGTGAGRRTKITSHVREKFLAELSDVPNVARAARIAGVSREMLYDLRANDEEFATQWQEALDYAIAQCEEEAIKRGRKGFVSRVFYDAQGRVKGRELTYSDRLLERVLEAHHPAYRRKHEVSGPGGGPVQAEVGITLADLGRIARQKGEG